ncbi:MAG TPA: hypothetical protein DCZ91_17050, partial [Lachnospiraceae bacterium]|nr:hypothetical protein [Lachnospiraceae bacterium]
MKLKKALGGILAVAMAITSASFAVLAENSSGGAIKESNPYALKSEVEYFRVGYLEDIVSGISLYGIRPGNFESSYYDQLDEDSKKVYDLLLNEYKSGGNDVKRDLVNVIPEADRKYVGLTGTVENNTLTLSDESKAKILTGLRTCITPAFLALSADHPEMTWLSHTITSLSYSTTNIQQSGDTFSLELAEVSFSLQSGYQYGNLQNMETAISKAKNVIDSKVSEDSTLYYETLVKNIHDYLCGTLIYNHDAADGKYNAEKEGYYQTAYSAFYVYNDDTSTSLSTVCAGYAKAFKVLCDSYGIPCILVSGKAGSNPGSDQMGPHMWNYVKMPNGLWYAVDVTWDDQDKIYDDFFLIGADSESTNFNKVAFKESHKASGIWSSTSLEFEFVYPDLSNDIFKEVGVYTYPLNTTNPTASPDPVETTAPPAET